jgi:AraC-like DNA-binding protein
MAMNAIRLGLDHRSAELRCGEVEHPAGIVQSGFITAQLACVWLQSGSGSMRRDGATHRLAAGDAFLRLPGRPHDVLMPGRSSWLYVAVPAAGLELLRRCGSLPDVLRPGPDARLAGRWRAATRRLGDCPEDGLAAMAAELLGLIAGLQHLAMRGARDPWLDRACAALEADLRRPLPAVAAALGLGGSAFRARFHAASGLSPRTWRIRRRIARAQELLAVPGAGLEAVAGQLGYPDLPTFAKQFRSVTGMAPGAWRRQLD